jgi:2,3-dimethylmalate lyase
VTILENGGKTPWVSPDEMYAMGFNIILYPTTLLFRQTRTIMRALDDLKAGRPMPKQEAVSMMEFEEIVDIAYWKSIEEKAMPMGERVRQAVNKVVKKIA